MGQVVAAMATVHAPQLFTRPPSEDPAQLDADIAAMRQLGKTLDETKPDLAIVLGSDHLETFFLSSVPTFAVIAGERTQAVFAGREYSLPTHLPFAEHMLDELVHEGFDMAYSQDAELGHSFAAVFEWVLEGRAMPVVPIFINTYLPPLPTARRAEALGKAIRKVIDARPERVAIIASGGMSHYPGTWKYSQPAFDFDYWAIAHMERGNHDVLLDLTVEQLDEVGNTEMLPWMVLFGAIGKVPGELLTYQPTWHHGHAVMRFIPTRAAAPEGESPKPKWDFQNVGGYQFYKHPAPASYPLNKLIYDLRHKQRLRIELLEDPKRVAANYHLTAAEMEKIDTLADESIDVFRSLKSHPLVELGAHPLGLLMCLVVVQAEGRRLRREKELQQQQQVAS
jgi:2,3-dihydroxyphenylpropionate 1,2-dioxygenase